MPWAWHFHLGDPRWVLANQVSSGGDDLVAAHCILENIYCLPALVTVRADDRRLRGMPGVCECDQGVCSVVNPNLTG